MYGVIYKITNKINGKIYIGQTIHLLEKRFQAHKTKSSGCLALKNAIGNHGERNFTIEPVIRCKIEDLDLKEIFCIRIYKSLFPNGYNLKSGGHRSKYSQVSKDKMSSSMKGRKSWKKGLKKEDNASIMAISKKLTGVKRSEATKLKVSLINRFPRPEYRKRLICLTNGVEYESLTAAGKALKINISHISDVCNGKLKQTKGFVFKYL